MDNIEKIKKLKIKTLVQTKKAEYWIKGTKEDSYNDLVKDFDKCTRQIKHMIQIKKRSLVYTFSGTNRIIFSSSS
jgi:hypothetical protein